ncbi:NAD-dependent epimerase/dehydratase family protein [Kribbella antibiotica]|uniref:NAD-dependent epimerase/dehydratase family protein n=1 Tax=Kribbella antibiotica TaxID=190195 RepID=A0A4V2YPF5_9ACTN|nr:NAD-dependent epimerase/dehydratase family protein [Kribbella antibiotica]TDD57787.1 NAD-dependent epimerase/dehydratase family protein [Kribbella antibiotica]
MTFSVVVGAGGTGRAVARLLADSGERVKLVTRSGSGPEHPGIERIAGDATAVDWLTSLSAGATTLYNCAMPSYDRWPTDWPPLAAALLTVAERSGADYVMLGNVYAYGPVTGLVVEDQPSAPTTVKGAVRAQMWADALAAHEAGRVRVTEVRGSDFLGADTMSVYNLLVVPAVLAGVATSYPADLDVEHSWTYVDDAARTMIAAARHDDAWGRAWHVPSVSALPVRALSAELAALASAPEPQVTELTLVELARLGTQDPITAELLEMQYLVRAPFLLDSTHSEAVLGVTATPLKAVLTETIDAHQHVTAR